LGGEPEDALAVAATGGLAGGVVNAAALVAAPALSAELAAGDGVSGTRWPSAASLLAPLAALDEVVGTAARPPIGV